MPETSDYNGNQVVYAIYWIGTLKVNNSFRHQTWSVKPSAIAGVRCIHLFLPWLISILRDLWGLAKLYQAWKKSMAWECIWRSLLQFMPLRTNLAKELRIVRLSRSMYEVLILPLEWAPRESITSSCFPNTMRWMISTTLPVSLSLHTCAYFSFG